MKPVSCVNPGGNGSYGGSQMWYQDKILINSGCGIIAGLDSLLNLMGRKEIDRSEYLDLMQEAAGYIRPIVLPFKVKPFTIAGNEFVGSFGLTMGRLKRGLRKMSRAKGLEVKVRSFRKKDISRIRSVLARGIPVIMLVRAPFNNVMMLSDTPSYKDDKIGQHFVTITDYDEEKDLLVVSSWGRRYKIDPLDLKKFSVGAGFCYVEPEKP